MGGEGGSGWEQWDWEGRGGERVEGEGRVVLTGRGFI